MKTYVLTVSKTFPVKHRRAGESTFFLQKIDQLNMVEQLRLFQPQKIHTIRSNYELWKRRIDQVNEGNATISVRYWSGKPYNSKQIEICQLNQGAVGCQKLRFAFNGIYYPRIEDRPITVNLEKIANNDGLSKDDFISWFEKYDLSEPMAIIHFTNFRY